MRWGMMLFASPSYSTGNAKRTTNFPNKKMLSDIKGKIGRELHKSARKNFPRRRVKVLGIGDLLQADLVEMIPYAKDNNGYKYLLTLIDCFSKKGYAAPVKDKTAENVKNAVESILPQN